MKKKYGISLFLLLGAPLTQAILGFLWTENKSKHHVMVRYPGYQVATIEPGQKKLLPTKRGGLCFVEQIGWPSTDSCLKFLFATKAEIENDPDNPIHLRARGWWGKKKGKWKYIHKKNKKKR